MAGLWFTHRFGWWRRDPVPGGRFNKMRVPPEMFARQVAWLAADGWRFLFLSEITGGGVPEKSVVLTFDDGYRDNLLNALPVLRRHGAKATLFPVVKRDAGYDWSSHKKAARRDGELGREEKLSDAEIREMLDSGLIELGGHSLTHANLPALSGEEARHEISGCKRALEEAFGVPVPGFCYPFGLFGGREAALAEEAGFVAAVTTEQGLGGEDLFAIPRVKISGTEGMFAFRQRLRTGRRN